jgi:hypothetical protein
MFTYELYKRGLKLKLCFKRYNIVCGSDFSHGQGIPFALKGMPSIGILSLGIPVRRPTLVGLDFPLTTLIGIASKRKQFLTCTQKIARAKIERLHSARLIQGDQEDNL